MKYYGIDPIDMEISRFLCLYSAVPEVERTFAPRSVEEQALDNVEAEIERVRIEDAEELGIDVASPLFYAKDIEV